jgi:DNA-binding CsgD family transcriptional regulator
MRVPEGAFASVEGSRSGIMPALQALRELNARLSSVGTAEAIGLALFDVARKFEFETSLIVDMTKLFDRLGPAIVFAAKGREAIDRFYAEERPFAQLPLVVRAMKSDTPFVMSAVKAETGADAQSWWEGLPPHLKDTDGLVVPVHEAGKLAWYAGFAGAKPDFTPLASSVMSAAVYAGYERFVELLDSRSTHSPLSPRESECLHWVSAGKTDFEIGTILSISPRTVRFHVNNAKVKLGVTTRIQAVAKRVSGAA